MTEQAKEARREYNRRYYQANREKRLKNQAEYWERKALKQANNNFQQSNNN